MKPDRANIMALEKCIQGINGYDPGGINLCKITEYFAPGVYAREMQIPKDVLITGKIHKTEHLNILSKGHVSVSNQGRSIEITAPHTFMSPVGTKRAIYAHEDSVWTTIHPTDLTDSDKIEKTLIAETFEELDGFIERQDYERFLIDCDLTEEDVQAVTHRDDEVILFNHVMVVKKSPIHGLGLFTEISLSEGQRIPAMVNGKRTIAGRYVNHSATPNTRVVVTNDKNIRLYTLQDIGSDEEITTDYRDNLKVQGLYK